MSHSLYAWDSSSFGDYLLDHHFASPNHHHHHHHSPALAQSRPCSSSSTSSHPLTISRQHPRFEATSWQGNDLYNLAAPESPLTSPEPEQDALPVPSTVKQEDTQEDFVFEVPATVDTTAAPAFNSMTEVPLRATQASKEMRRMMGVFRLDPFTMHNAVRDPDANLNWNGEPIGPLTESPRLIDFALDCYGDHVKSEQPTLLQSFAEDSEPSRKRRRLSPLDSTEYSPSPSLGYRLGSPSASPLQTQGHSWSGSSSDSHSLGYASDLLRHDQQYDTVLTPAQGMDASVNMNFTSRYSSSLLRMPSHSTSMPVSLSSITRPAHSSRSQYMASDSPPLSYLAPSPSSTPSASPSYIHPSAAISSSQYGHTSGQSSYPSSYGRPSLAYTDASPIRLPRPASTRYAMQDLVMGSTEISLNHSDDSSEGSWGTGKTTPSLAMFYSAGSSKDTSSSLLSSGAAGSGLALAQPHTVSTMATRRLASSSLMDMAGSAHGGVNRSSRTAWM